MLKITIPKEPLSSQIVELDGDGKEYTIKFKWIARFQKFYMSIYDVDSTPLVSGVKVVQGAPINLPFLEAKGPQGVFLLKGSGDTTRSNLNGEAYTLYYLPRSDRRVPLLRSFTVNTDFNIFLAEEKEYQISLIPPLIPDQPPAANCESNISYVYPAPSVNIQARANVDYDDFSGAVDSLNDPNVVFLGGQHSAIVNRTQYGGYASVSRRASKYDFTQKVGLTDDININIGVTHFGAITQRHILFAQVAPSLPAVNNPLYNTQQGGGSDFLPIGSFEISNSSNLSVNIKGLVPQSPNVWLLVMSEADYLNDFSDILGTEHESSIGTGGGQWTCPL